MEWLQDWTAALVPTAAAQLCCASCENAAAALVVAHTGLHSAFASIDSGLALLGDYMQAHVSVFEGHDGTQMWDSQGPCMQHSVQQLWQALPGLLQSALKHQEYV